MVQLTEWQPEDLEHQQVSLITGGVLGDASADREESEIASNLYALRGVKVAFATVAALMLLGVILGPGMVEKFTSYSDITDNDGEADMDNRVLQDDDWRAMRTRQLTAEYIRLQTANDFDSLQKLFSPTSEVHFDVSQAPWIVGASVRRKTGTDFQGPERLLTYYRAYPSQPGDVHPEPWMFDCTGMVCTVNESMRRWGLTLNAKGVFTWGPDDKLDVMKLSLW